MAITVWSEQYEPSGGGWKDCTYSGYLMALDFGGWTKWPLGWHTVNEREALERSDSRPDETGATLVNADEASKNRYGVVLRPVTESLSTALTRVGTALVMQGDNSKLPSTLQNGFTGGHCVTVVPIGNGYVTWLDPLEAMGFAGKTVSTATVLNWSYGQSYARVVNANEFGTSGVYEMNAQVNPGQFVDCKSGGTLYLDQACTQVGKSQWAGGSGVGTYGTYTRADGKVMRAVRVDYSTGDKDLRVSYYGNDLCSNLTGTVVGGDVKHKVALAIDGVIDATTERSV